MRDAVASAMAWTCWATRHVGCCGLLGPSFVFGYDDERDTFRLTIPNPLHRLWRWSLDLERRYPREVPE